MDVLYNLISTISPEKGKYIERGIEASTFGVLFLRLFLGRKGNMIYTIYFASFVSGINSVMSLRVNPSPKIFNIMFNVCVVTDWLFFNR